MTETNDTAETNIPDDKNVIKNLVLSSLFSIILFSSMFHCAQRTKKIKRYQTIRSPFLHYGVYMTICILFVQSFGFSETIPFQLITESASYSFCLWALFDHFGVNIISPALEMYSRNSPQISHSFSFSSKGGKLSLNSRNRKSWASGSQAGRISHRSVRASLRSASISSISSYPSGTSYSHSTLTSILPSEIWMDKLSSSSVSDRPPKMFHGKNLLSEDEKIVSLLLFQIVISMIMSCLIADYQGQNYENLNAFSLHRSRFFVILLFSLHGVYILCLIGLSLFKVHSLSTWIATGSLIGIILGVVRDLMRTCFKEEETGSVYNITLSFGIGVNALFWRIYMCSQIEKHNSLIFPTIPTPSIRLSVADDPMIVKASRTDISHLRIEEGNEEDCKSDHE